MQDPIAPLENMAGERESRSHARDDNWAKFEEYARQRGQYQGKLIRFFLFAINGFIMLLIVLKCAELVVIKT